MRVFVLLALLTVAVRLSAQTSTGDGDDFGVDMSVRVVDDFGDGFSWTCGVNWRTQDNSRRTERWGVEGGFAWRFWRSADKHWNLKASFDVEQIWRQKLSVMEAHYKTDDDGVAVLDADGNPVQNGYNGTARYWRNRQRYSLGLEGTWKPSKRWQVEWKETLQWSHYETTDSVERTRWRYNDDDELYLKSTQMKVYGKKDRWVLRSKLTLTYDIKGLPIDPFVSADYGCGLNYSADKWRLSAGIDYKLNKKHRLTLFYRYTTENSEDETDGHLVGVGYRFAL